MIILIVCSIRFHILSSQELRGAKGAKVEKIEEPQKKRQKRNGTDLLTSILCFS